MKWQDIIKRGYAGRGDAFDFKEYGASPTKRQALRTKKPGRIYADKPRKPLSPERRQQANKKAAETKKLNEEKRLREEKARKEAKYTGGQFLDKPVKEEEEKEPFNPFNV
tara:strand:- start:2823 stop:3152 length:330 start_codon:yes stop_codon:yes gene_type:complete